VSPNRDGFRDAATVHFRLRAPATVTLEALRSGRRPQSTRIWQTRARLGAGEHALVWRPDAATQPRTYLLRLSANGRTSPARPVVRVQGIDAGFTRRSYAPGQSAELTIATDARSLRLQVFAYSGGAFPGPRDVRTSGTPMTPPVRADWSAHRDRPATLRVLRTGDWASGIYFLRLSAGDGRVGYAPFIVRPRALGQHRVAVVLGTNTWQAYNFEDADGNGWGDSWYVDPSHGAVDLGRPFLDFGLPFRFKDWDLAFVTWLSLTGKQVDFISDDDLEAASGDELARAYDLIVFPGHEEYVTVRAYDAVERFRDLGGNLAFLAANNFFWQVRRDGDRIRKVALWRDLGRPEAALVGVQYLASNRGANQRGYVVDDPDSWAFAGTGLAAGTAWGSYGIEIDARTAASPPGTRVLARVPNVLGPGLTAEMTYYETPRGAKVFAAGTLNFAASIDQPPVSLIVENVWNRLSRP
jgi:hypothetical protein